jgi:hypothetical protein
MVYITMELPASLMVGVFCPHKAIPAIKEPDNTPIKRYLVVLVSMALHLINTAGLLRAL